MWVRTIHRANVYTPFQRSEQGVRLIYGCVLYTRNYGNHISIDYRVYLDVFSFAIKAWF